MKRLRCLLAALLLLVFGGGAALASAQASVVVQPAVQVSVDQSPASNCNKCGGSHMAIMAATCSALGTCMQGVIPPSEGAMPRAKSIAYSYSPEHISDFRRLPEPFPPKPYILA
jgi:hypothetical protein